MPNYQLKNYPVRILLYAVILSIVGIVAISSASAPGNSRVLKQFLGIGVSLMICITVSLIDYHWYGKVAMAIYGVCDLLLAAVLLQGSAHKGAIRWLQIGPVQIQPSEFVKIGIIVFLSWYLAKHKDSMNQPQILARIVLLCALPLIMVYMQPNLSTTIVLLVMILCIIYSGGLSYRWIAGSLALGVPSLIMLIYFALRGMVPFFKQYQAERILARFFNSDNQYADLNRQQNNSIMAIGSGKLAGKGLFNSSLSSVKNGNFLSEEKTDFIFAIIGEELGFTGCVALICLYLLLVIECLWLASRAKDQYGRLICTGMASLIAFQSFANIAVATGIFPNTGLPLPFISYGVSSLLSMFIGIGLVLNVGLQRENAQD